MTTLPRPKVAERPAPLPSAEMLSRHSVTFEPVSVGQPDSPVRLRHHGFCCGVFPTREQAAPCIRQITNP